MIEDKIFNKKKNREPIENQNTHQQQYRAIGQKKINPAHIGLKRERGVGGERE